MSCRRPLAQPAAGHVRWPFVGRLTVGSDSAGVWAVPARGLLPLSFRHSLFCLLWALRPEPCGACSTQGLQGTLEEGFSSDFSVQAPQCSVAPLLGPQHGADLARPLSNFSHIPLVWLGRELRGRAPPDISEGRPPQPH